MPQVIVEIAMQPGNSPLDPKNFIGKLGVITDVISPGRGPRKGQYFLIAGQSIIFLLDASEHPIDEVNSDFAWALLPSTSKVTLVQP